MDLSSLVFKADTSELDRAGKAIGELVVNVGKLDKASKDAARVETALAKAAKDNAKATLDNAKAQQVQAKAVENTEKAQRSTATAVEKTTSILERQKDILEFQTQGFSKGQSSVLAYGKAAGLVAADITELGKVLETQRKLMGGDPFDKSLSGLKSLQNQYTELKESVRQYATDSNLSAKQTRELARDKERLIEKMKVEGASFSDIRKAVRAHNDEYVTLASSYNKMTSAEDAVIKSRKDAVTATNYLTQADQKLAAALNTSNVSLDKAGTDSLVKYESALRKSGLAQDVIVTKLASYKAQLTQVTALENKRKEQHLARALSPQLTDIGVSLYSGQAPLTVLLQQGGQIADLLRLSGVEAQNFGKALRDAFGSMIPVMATVAKGLSSFAFSLLQEAGTAVTSFIGKITGISAAMDIAKRAIASGGEENFKYIASLQRIGTVASTVAAVGIMAVITLLVTMALEYKKIIQSEAQLSTALATSGGAMAMSKDQAVVYAESMQSLGIGTLKAMDAISEFAKAGKIGKDGLDLIIKSALDLEKYAGVSIADTAKQYAKLQDEPTKALVDIAEKTGLVSAATLDYVATLEQQGDKTKAAEEATKALTTANTAMAGEIKSNMSPIEALWDDIRSAIGKVKQEIYDLTTANANISAMKTVWETVSVVVAEVWFTLKGVGKEIGGVAAQIASVMRGDFAGAKTIGEQMKVDAASARAEQDKLIESILNRGKTEKQNFTESKEQNSQYAAWRKDNEKALERQYSKEERLGLKKKQLQNDLNAGIIDEVKYKQALAGWDRIIMGEKKPKKDPSENYYATLMREATNNTIAADNATEKLTKSELKLLEVKADPRFEKLNALQKSEVAAKYEGAIASEKQALYTKQLTEAEEFRLKILGKSTGLGAQYSADAQKLLEYAKIAGWSADEIEVLVEALYKSTPAWKEQEKALEAVSTALKKFKEESIASQASTSKENDSLDYRLSLLGKTTEEQKAIAVEYTRASKLREVDVKLAKQLREIEEAITKAKKAGRPSSDYQLLVDAEIQAEKDAAEERKVINRGVAVQFAEDLDKEIRAIKDGITDSIVTALFDGGEAGSKKIRDLLVAELKKPVTMYVSAIVNTVVGGALNSVLGSAASASSGSSSLGMASSLASSSFGMGMEGTIATISEQGFISGFSNAMTSASSLASAGSFSGALGAALPYIGAAFAAYAVLDNLGVFGSKFTSAENSGRARIDYSSSGVGGTAYSTTGTAEQSATAAKSVDSLAQSYFKTAAALGLQAMQATFEVGYNTGKEGASPNTVLGVNVGGLSYSSGEISSSDSAALSLAASRAVLTALQASTLPDYLVGAFNDATGKALDASTLTQDQISTLLTNTTAVASFHNALQSLPFDSLKNLSYSASKSLAEFSGSLETLQTNLSDFFSKFYTAEEQAIASQKSIASNITSAGFGISADAIAAMTKDDYRKLVEAAMGDTSDAGNKLTASLLASASAFDSLKTAQEAAAKVTQDWQDKLDVLTNKTTQAQLDQQQQLAAVTDGATKAIMRQVFAIENRNTAMDAVTTAVETEKKRLQTEYDALTKTLEDALTPLDKSISKLQSFSDKLKSTLNSLSIAGDAGITRRTAQGEISAALATARSGGGLPLDGQLDNALSVVSQSSEKLFGNFSDYAKDFYKTANDISALSDLTNAKKTADELIQSILQDQLDNAKKEFDAQVVYLDKQVDLAQKAVDAANGTTSAVLSVEQALKELYALIDPDSTKNTTGGSSTTGGERDRSGNSRYVPGDPTSTIDYGGTPVSGAKYTQYYKIPGYGTTGIGITDPAEVARLDSIAASLGQYSWATSDVAASANAIYAQAQASGFTLQEIANAAGYAYSDVAALFNAAGIPSFSEGTNRTKEGLAYLHKDEAVVPARYNPAIGNSSSSSNEGSSNAELVAKLDAMVQKLAAIEASNQLIEKHTKDSERTLTAVTKGGTTMRTDVSSSVLTL